MAWLVTHMWMTLAVFGVLGLMFGWSIRGAMLLGKMRRATVERDVLQTELDQAKGEIEELYAAQRSGTSAAAGAGDAALKGELEERERRMSELSAELSNSKAELERLRAEGPKAAPAAAVAATSAVAGAAVGARLDDNLNHEDAALVWRNRHLESRVRHLEGKVHDLGQAAGGEAVAEPQAQPQETDAAPEVSESADAGIAHDKLAWRANYLNDRVSFLEGKIAADGRMAEAAQAVPPMAADTEGTSDSEELASLRWRNRYLEGRLAYYEGETEEGVLAELQAAEAAEAAKAVEDITEANESILGDTAPGEAVSPEDQPDAYEPVEKIAEADDHEMAETVAAVGAAVAAGAADLSPEAAGPAEDADQPEGEVEAVAEAAAEEAALDDAAPEMPVGADADAHAEAAEMNGQADIQDEAVTAEVDTPPMPAEETAASSDMEKPLALDAPVAGQPDDLTVIGGVGPKIQEVLNELGIYHFDQIAAWSPENVAWVDDHLSFSGRIARERWVEQAQVLVGDGE